MQKKKLKRKIRVLHIGADNIGYGGRSVLVYNLAQNMDAAKVRNDFLCFKNIDPLYESKVRSHNGEIQYVLNLPDRKNRIRFEFVRANKIISIMKRNRYDIVHIHADHAYEAMKSALLAKKSGCGNIIVHAHATGNEEKDFFFKRKLIKICQKLMFFFCNETFACSKEAAKYMFGRIPHKINIIKNGIDLENYRYNSVIRKKIRNKFGLEDKVVIGCVGRLASSKNHLFLLEVFYKYLQSNEKAVLMLVGDGELKNRIINKAKEMGMLDTILFLGNCTNVTELLQAMDVFVLTSKHEGFGIVNIEAQAAGLPCVISDVVPKSAMATDKFKFLNLSEPVENWVNAIISFEQEKNNRFSDIERLKEQGFSISETAAFLQKKYIDLVYRQKNYE